MSDRITISPDGTRCIERDHPLENDDSYCTECRRNDYTEDDGLCDKCREEQ